MMIVKKMTWIVATLLVLAVTGGCGQPKSTPEEAALIYCNAVVKLDFTGAETIGLGKEQQTQLAAVHKQAFRDNAKTVLKTADLEPITTRIDSLTDSLERINRKIEFKAELVSKEQDSAIVKVSVRTTDGHKFYADVVTPALQSEAYAQKQGDDEKGDFLIQLFSKNIDQVTLVKEPKTFEMKLTLNKWTGCWQTDTSFLKPLSKAVKQ